MSNSVYDFKVKDISNNDVSLDQYKGKAMLFVNVASKCGFTNQYEGLENLYKKYSDKGFVILGFPCNQFGGQEPGDESEIKEFCSLNYNVTFPMFKKIDVNGDDAAPVYEYLKGELPGLMGSKGVKWNFTKFLIDNNGKPVKRFAPKDKPEDIDSFLSEMLGA